MCASANSSYETMKTSEALDDVGPRNTIAKDNERGSYGAERSEAQ
jgi:hypothetical protein